jgi:hypothetical protein
VAPEKTGVISMQRLLALTWMNLDGLGHANLNLWGEPLCVPGQTTPTPAFAEFGVPPPDITGASPPQPCENNARTIGWHDESRCRRKSFHGQNSKYRVWHQSAAEFRKHIACHEISNDNAAIAFDYFNDLLYGCSTW